MNYETDMKNRVYFTMYSQYLTKTDIKIAVIKINNRLDISLPYSICSLKNFSYKLNADEISDLNKFIEKRTAHFRGSCLLKIHEYSIHYSDRTCQKPRINQMINAMNKVCDPAAGMYFT